MFWGALSGFTSTLIQIGAPPYYAFVLPQRLEKMIYVGTTVMFFAAANAMKVVPYFALGQFSTAGLATSFALFPLAIASNFLGIWLVRVTPEAMFYQITNVHRVRARPRTDAAGRDGVDASERAVDRGLPPSLTCRGSSHGARSPYDTDLDRNPANFQPLTPLTLLERAASVFPDQLAIVHGPLRRSYREFYARARQLASALTKRGIGRGDTVSAVLANTPAMLECHYGVPMAGAVLNTINTRLDAAVIAFQLDHGDAKVLITDREFSKVVKEALALCKVKPLVIDYDDPEFSGAGERLGAIEYEDFIKDGDPDFAWAMPDDEWDAIALNYTSGTTGDPKGVVYHHRGAHLLAVSNVLTCGMGPASGLSLDAADVPLQRLVLSLDDLGGGRHACLPARGARQGDVRRHRRRTR